MAWFGLDLSEVNIHGFWGSDGHVITAGFAGAGMDSYATVSRSISGKVNAALSAISGC